MYNAVRARRTTPNSTEVRPNFGQIARRCWAQPFGRIVRPQFGKTELQPTSNAKRLFAMSTCRLDPIHSADADATQCELNCRQCPRISVTNLETEQILNLSSWVELRRPCERVRRLSWPSFQF